MLKKRYKVHNCCQQRTSAKISFANTSSISKSILNLKINAVVSVAFIRGSVRLLRRRVIKVFITVLLLLRGWLDVARMLSLSYTLGCKNPLMLPPPLVLERRADHICTSGIFFSRSCIVFYPHSLLQKNKIPITKSRRCESKIFLFSISKNWLSPLGYSLSATGFFVLYLNNIF